jgi:hypothetical protein
VDFTPFTFLQGHIFSIHSIFSIIKGHKTGIKAGLSERALPKSTFSFGSTALRADMSKEMSMEEQKRLPICRERCDTPFCSDVKYPSITYMHKEAVLSQKILYKFCGWFLWKITKLWKCISNMENSIDILYRNDNMNI